MRKRIAIAIMTTIISGSACTASPSPSALHNVPAKSTAASDSKPPTVTAGDDFSGPVGSAPDAGRWAAETGGDGWGNSELEYYTNRATNVSLDGLGDLAITARAETFTGPDKVTRRYTSARLSSTFAVGYGWIQARIMVQAGQGLWPAFWTLGADYDTVGWPASGEIDIFESTNDMKVIHGSIHGPAAGSDPSYDITTSASPIGGLAGSWHTYAIDWKPSSITWYLDGQQYATIQKSHFPASDAWEFDKPQRLLLNLAVGGLMPHAPDETTPLPSVMLIDYVHVYSNAAGERAFAHGELRP